MATRKKRERRKDERPAEILKAAIAEFAERGFGAAKIENIAKRCGVAKGTVYLYYATKEELFEAMVRDQIRPNEAEAKMLFESWQGSAFELLKIMTTRLYLDSIDNAERRMVLKILISESDRFEHLARFYYDEFLSNADDMLRKIVKMGIDSGEFRDSPIAKEPRVLIAPAIFAAVWKMTFEKAEKLKMQRWLDAHLDLILHGLKK